MRVAEGRFGDRGGDPDHLRISHFPSAVRFDIIFFLCYSTATAAEPCYWTTVKEEGREEEEEEEEEQVVIKKNGGCR